MRAQEAMNVRSRVQALQRRLSRAATQQLDRKFRALYDRRYRENILWGPWEKARASNGAPGVDQDRFDYIETEIGGRGVLGGDTRRAEMPATPPAAPMNIHPTTLWRKIKRLNPSIPKQDGRKSRQ